MIQVKIKLPENEEIDKPLLSLSLFGDGDESAIGSSILISSVPKHSTHSERGRGEAQRRLLENYQKKKGDYWSKDIEPMLSSIMSWSSITAVEGFKNGGLEYKLSKCSTLFL